MSISATDNAGRIATATVTFGVGQVQRALSGALLFFMGVARREGKDCREVVKLEMESY
ncbi:MAG: hypothetical protein HYY67_05375 [Thaumarchaeota archaeon]|nr:hypothetical protein [Nitrososphaerota archaeon]